MPIYFNGIKDDTVVEIAMQYNDSYMENIYSFVNNINTEEGGTRSGTSKRWLTRIFHPPPRTSPVTKWRNDAIPHERRSRRAPESYAPSTFFRPADASPDGSGAAGGLHRTIGTHPPQPPSANVPHSSPATCSHRPAPRPRAGAGSERMRGAPHAHNPHDHR